VTGDLVPLHEEKGARVLLGKIGQFGRFLRPTSISGHTRFELRLSDGCITAVNLNGFNQGPQLCNLPPTSGNCPLKRGQVLKRGSNLIFWPFAADRPWNVRDCCASIKARASHPDCRATRDAALSRRAIIRVVVMGTRGPRPRALLRGSDDHPKAACRPTNAGPSNSHWGKPRQKGPGTRLLNSGSRERQGQRAARPDDGRPGPSREEMT